MSVRQRGSGAERPEQPGDTVGIAAPFREVALAPPILPPTRLIIARTDGDQLAIEAKRPRSWMFGASILWSAWTILYLASQIGGGHITIPVLIMGGFAVAYGMDFVARTWSRTTIDIDNDRLRVRLRGPLRRTLELDVPLSDVGSPVVGEDRDGRKPKYFLYLPGLRLPPGVNNRPLLEGHDQKHVEWVARQMADYIDKHRRALPAPTG